MTAPDHYQNGAFQGWLPQTWPKQQVPVCITQYVPQSLQNRGQGSSS